jgi:hypothetical protein
VWPRIAPSAAPNLARRKADKFSRNNANPHEPNGSRTSLGASTSVGAQLRRFPISRVGGTLNRRNALYVVMNNKTQKRIVVWYYFNF